MHPTLGRCDGAAEESRGENELTASGRRPQHILIFRGLLDDERTAGMPNLPSDSIAISAELAGQTLAAVVRAHQPGRSWSEVRRFIAHRLVKLNGELCLDPARRVKEGD